MTHHRRGLRRWLRDDAALAQLDADPWSPGAAARLASVVGARRAAVLAYVEKLTLAPASMTRADVERLRSQGFSDADVLAVCETAAYYAYANRIADGLGVELEAHMESDAD